MTCRTKSFQFGPRRIGGQNPPLVIAEIGINHEGELAKAVQMVDDAAAAGCECVKFQCHVIEDEYVPAAKAVIPGNASESILEIMQRCALGQQDEAKLKAYAESKGLIYLSSPFSRAAANRLEQMDVVGFKIGSGECNNLPLVRHIAQMGKPIIVSTGMNDLVSISKTVDVLNQYGVSFALLHCTSLYPTPYDRVRLGALAQMARQFPGIPLGLSCHSLGIHTAIAAIALGATVVEKHFTSDKNWPGPDIPISIDPAQLAELVIGSRAVFEALGGDKTVLVEEQPTIDFAYASVVSIAPISAGTIFSSQNLWVKRPGTGEILASEFDKTLGKRALRDIPPNSLLRRSDVGH